MNTVRETNVAAEFLKKLAQAREAGELVVTPHASSVLDSQLLQRRLLAARTDVALDLRRALICADFAARRFATRVAHALSDSVLETELRGLPEIISSSTAERAISSLPSIAGMPFHTAHGCVVRASMALNCARVAECARKHDEEPLAGQSGDRDAVSRTASAVLTDINAMLAASKLSVEKTLSFYQGVNHRHHDPRVAFRTQVEMMQDARKGNVPPSVVQGLNLPTLDRVRFRHLRGVKWFKREDYRYFEEYYATLGAAANDEEAYLQTFFQLYCRQAINATEVTDLRPLDSTLALFFSYQALAWARAWREHQLALCKKISEPGGYSSSVSGQLLACKEQVDEWGARAAMFAGMATGGFATYAEFMERSVTARSLEAAEWCVSAASAAYSFALKGGSAPPRHSTWTRLTGSWRKEDPATTISSLSDDVVALCLRLTDGFDA